MIGVKNFVLLLTIGGLGLIACNSSVSPKECEPGSVDCECTEGGTCEGDLLCDLDTAQCREKLNCKDLDCQEQQECKPAGAGDAACLESCEAGYTWDEAEGQCLQEPPSCDPELDNEMVSECNSENRRCLTAMSGAFCGACQDGYAEEAGECRVLLSCDDLECEELGRDCVEASERRDAACGECQSGSQEVDNLCLALTCGPSVSSEQSRLDCDAEHRLCKDDACAGCQAGFVEKEGTCIAVKDCELLGCAALNRRCVPSEDHGDASCDVCRAGFFELSGDCVAQAGASCQDGVVESIKDACSSENRVCVSGGAGQPASCGECVAGFLWDDQVGACVEEIRCSELDCAAEDKKCVELPNAHCEACLPGFIDDRQNGGCRPVIECDDIECGAGEVCASSTQTDAVCEKDCGADAIWNGLRCEPCPPCNEPGEVGRWPLSTRAGACMCETSAGYFYYSGGDIGTQQCDADGDGWVRESARPAVESNDTSLSVNARCDVRVIDRFVLVNEAGQERVERLREPLPLYESDRNDDVAVLQAKWNALKLPSHYGVDANSRIPEPAELNRMTKFCHALRTDYNDNGVFDVEEFGAKATPSLRSDQRPFNEFSYFAELHRGYYVAPGAGESYGQYRIEERSRGTVAGSAAGDVPLNYASGDSDAWRTCERGVDINVSSLELLPVGLDFANLYEPPNDPFEVAADSWKGMTHHSQFQCLVLNNDASETIPTVVTPGQVQAEGMRLNRCEMSGDGTALDPNVKNPIQAPVSCSYLDSNDASVKTGAVFWSAVPFIDHQLGIVPGEPEYQRGCLNGCFAELASCPGFATNPASVVCEYSPAEFGEFISCDVAEICDGIDNDENPATLDGSDDPLLGQRCQPEGLKGECFKGGGEWVCNAAPDYRTCVADVNPVAEVCNGLDDNCDGEVDDGNPGADGGACTPTTEELTAAGIPPERQNGECLRGERADCVDGRNVCVPTVFPKAEVCGNLKDDDCDGVADESEFQTPGGLERLAELGASQQPGCAQHYRDSDGDGFGNDLYALCLCPVGGASLSVTIEDPATNQTTNYNYASKGEDCCDAVDTFYPGAGGWLSTGDSRCTLPFDKNCDGNQTQRYNSIVEDGCGLSGFECAVPGVGWKEGSVFVVPACGQSATYYYYYGSGGCNNDGARICEQEERQQTQQCQ